MIAGEYSEAAGINRKRFVQPKFRGKICHRVRPENTGVPGSPGPIGFQILQHPAVGVVHAAMKHQLGSTILKLGQRELTEQGNGIVVEFIPARWVKIEEQAGRVVTLTPP